MDHIQNALTKTKNPPKKYKNGPTFFAPKNTKTPPKNTEMAPTVFRLKKYKNTPK
jgi:hypothetical protein